MRVKIAVRRDGMAIARVALPTRQRQLERQQIVLAAVLHVLSDPDSQGKCRLPEVMRALASARDEMQLPLRQAARASCLSPDVVMGELQRLHHDEASPLRFTSGGWLTF